jgi:phosphate transport system substrate-binding protein
MKLILTTILALGISTSAYARDQIRVVGSSTVFPFSTVVAEQFSKTTSFKSPVIESTGTGGGMKLFCSGVGVEHPDITNASRAIKKSEAETCAKNGVTPIEVMVGYDGIAIANSKDSTQLRVSSKELFLALAKEVPVDGVMVLNPYQTWSEINPSLPSTKIEVLGPPPTSGTRDAFLELVMEKGAKTFPELKSLNKKAFKAAAHTIREDGAFIEAGENDNLIVQKLVANPSSVGIFGFSFLEENRDKVQGSFVDGVEPSFEAIADGSYGVSRPLFFYVKKEHLDVIPGIKTYVDLFLSKNMSGDEGYLLDKGLIPLPNFEENRSKVLSSF